LRAVVQRVSRARVVVDGETVADMGAGVWVLLGVAEDDGEGEATRLAGKVAHLRIFENEQGGGVEREAAKSAGAAQSQQISPHFRLPVFAPELDYPRPCTKCGVTTDEDGFGIDRSKPSGRRSYCKACDRRRGNAYYAEHRDELQAQRDAVREAAWQAHLKELEKEHRKRVAAAKKLHAAQVRNQKKLLRELGVPDLSPEEVSERAQAAQGRRVRDALAERHP
jgi:D-Tyr-tRNAtyr deacylase